MKFRSHIPENCPPEDARMSSGQVYRMVKEAPSPEDFLSFRELKPDKAYLCCFVCLRVPRFRKMNVALGELDENQGKMKNTPSRLHESHHTWWLAEDIEPWTFFAVVNIEDET